MIPTSRRSISGVPMAERRIPVLDVRGLHVRYGQSPVLHGVDLALDRGVLSLVGRNGMGKTTLCNAIMGLIPATSGTVSFRGRTVTGLPTAEIARAGIGYVPQGRRIWRSLTVDEHLRLAARPGGNWPIDRIYSTFPRLAERRAHAGRHLSGGEQQMLAIGRALLLDPSLLLMDEPTEGLAPMIVHQVEEMLIRLGEDDDVDVLVIEQNIGVACRVSPEVAIMVNGRINRIMDSGALASDRELQQTLLGVGRHDDDTTTPESGSGDPTSAPGGGRSPDSAGARGPRRIYLSNPSLPTRWSRPVPVQLIERSARTETPVRERAPVRRSRLARSRGTVYVAGTLDTKGRELRFLRDRIRTAGLDARLADLSTAGGPSGADVPPHAIAGYHPRGASAVFTGDRGRSVAAMAEAFRRWTLSRDDIVGMIGAGGSGATALVAPAMQSLPVGVPKLIVSTVASGDVGQYVGPADILMLHAVADVQGLNAITRDVLANGAAAIAGMVAARIREPPQFDVRPAVGLTMFGVTTPCVQQITAALEADWDCLVFHATGTGGRCMEHLLDSGRLSAVIDITTTEVADMIAGGVFAADEDRFGAVIRSGTPYVGACGALDMVNFGAMEAVPDRYRGRLLHPHNPQVTLMRTTPEENAAAGRWIGGRLNEMTGPVRFFLPEGGVSMLDRPEDAFWDPEADRALFTALEETVRQTPDRQLVRTPANVNDPEFVAEVLAAFRALNAKPDRRAAAAAGGGRTV